MRASVLLYHDWDDYDKRKVREHLNPQIFSCDHAWEARYLASKIKLLYPDLRDDMIFKAIKSCCTTCSDAPIRSTFVNYVVESYSATANEP